MVMGLVGRVGFDLGPFLKVEWSMTNQLTNPSFFRMNTLLSLEVSEVHSLARKAVGSLTSYRLLLGRCLLAMRETKGFKRYGCSSEIHYSVARLGLTEGVAGECRRVARNLIGLPDLTLAAEHGHIEWSKLREVSRKASPETEAFWLKLCGDLNYKQIEKLVSKTPKGALPGDAFEETERATTEFRCRMSEEVLAMLDRARRIYSLEQDKAVTTAEVLEWALASYISNQMVDEETLEKVRLEMDKDLQAQTNREIPLVAKARGVAEEMGFIPICEVAEDESVGPRAGENSEGDAGSFETPVNQTDTESCCANCSTDQTYSKNERLVNELLGAIGGMPSPELFETDDKRMDSARTGKIQESDQPIFRNQTGGSQEGGESAKAEGSNRVAGVKGSPARAAIDYLKALENIIPPIQNKNVCFNPHNRFATKAQKREVLRREGWCCATPGCPHKIWLHLHHLIPYSHGGPTLAHNLLGICVSCHGNVHDGSLKIFLDDKGQLQFTDAKGNSLAEQADLMLASWFDFNEGWHGEREDSYKMRWGRGEWSVFEHPR